MNLVTASADRGMQLWKVGAVEQPDPRIRPHRAGVRPGLAARWLVVLGRARAGRPSFLSYKKENGDRAAPIEEKTMSPDWVYAGGRLARRPDRGGRGLGRQGPDVVAEGRQEAARVRAGATRMILVLMGVSGTGKTTVGKILADRLGWTFVEGDDYHPAANKAKMHAGIPLTDEDRWPWLDALRHRIDEARERGENLVLACSALKHAYQVYLRHDLDLVHYVYLEGSEALIRERLAHRTGHFMNPGLLHSQFETLEPPEQALRVDVGPRRTWWRMRSSRSCPRGGNDANSPDPRPHPDRVPRSGPGPDDPARGRHGEARRARPRSGRGRRDSRPVPRRGVGRPV